MQTIRGIVYKKLGRRKAIGLVEPDSDIIYADERLNGEELLDVLCHECTHILQPYLTEEYVNHIGLEMSKMLWKDGWRKVDMGDNNNEIEENTAFV